MSSKARSQRIASWAFGTAAFLFLLWVFVWGPDELPPAKVKILALVCSCLAGFFGYFFTGTVSASKDANLPWLGKIAIRAGGGAALFLVTLLWWSSSSAPVSVEKPSLSETARRWIENEARQDLPIYQTTPEMQAKLMGRSNDSLEGMRAQGFLNLANDTTDPEKCIEHTTEALALEPAFPWAHLLRAKAYADTQKYDQAISDYTAVIDAVPDFGLARMGRAIAHLSKERYKDALPDLQFLASAGDTMSAELVQVIEQGD